MSRKKITVMQIVLCIAISVISLCSCSKTSVNSEVDAYSTTLSLDETTEKSFSEEFSEHDSTANRTEYKTEETSETENITNETTAESMKPDYNVSVNSDCKITVTTALNQQMGKSPIKPDNATKDKIIGYVNQLSLTEISKPESSEFPIGGAMVLCVNSTSGKTATYSFYSKDLIEIDGKYYKDSSDAYDSLVSIITGILFNN